MSSRSLTNSIGLAILLLALVYTIWAAASLLVPLVIALFGYLVLSVPMLRLRRLGLPASVASLLLAGLVFGSLAFMVTALVEPVSDIFSRVPYSYDRIETRLRGLLEPLKAIQEASESVEAVTEDEDVQRVVIDDNIVRDQLFSNTYAMVSGLGITVVLTGFLLLDGGRFGRNLAGLLPDFPSIRRALVISRAVQDHLAHYLLTITLINFGLGVAVALVLWVIGVPQPIVWGAIAGFLNFIPFIGPLVTIVLLTIVMLGLPEPSARYIMAPLAVFVLNLIEANLVTPSMLAMRLRLSSVAIIISVVFWGWLWGVAGVVLAVPILATINIVSLHIPQLRPFARVIGGNSQLG